MASQQSIRWFALLQRELQEYKNSLLWTPLGLVLGLAALMLVSVLVANRISALGDAMLQVVMEQDALSGMNITIHIDDEDSSVQSQTYRIEEQTGPVDEQDWNFSREWKFKPKQTPDHQEQTGDTVGSLNPMFSMLHNLMMMVLALVTVNYLLGCLFTDRKDRSILFWKSMPVSAWDEILAKLAVALLVAPAIYIAASLIAQVVSMVLAMLMVWRMDKDPFELILGNIDFGQLLVSQVGGWLQTVLWVTPAAAWLMLASAAARRSPFMLALTPVIGLIVLEAIFLGSDHVTNAVLNHIPHHVSGGSAVGFYFDGPQWSSLNLVSMLGGLCFALLALWAAVWLRRHRWEL